MLQGALPCHQLILEAWFITSGGTSLIVSWPFTLPSISGFGCIWPVTRTSPLFSCLAPSQDGQVVKAASSAVGSPVSLGLGSLGRNAPNPASRHKNVFPHLLALTLRRKGSW